MEYSQIILELMSQKGISAYRLAKDTGISESLFSKWRSRPTSDISATNLSKIAEYMNVSIDYLLTGDKKRSPAPNLTDAELEALEAFRRLDPVEQGKIIGRMEAMAEKS